MQAQAEFFNTFFLQLMLYHLILMQVVQQELKKVPFLSNPMPYPECLYLSISTFLVKATAPNKQFSNVG